MDSKMDVDIGKPAQPHGLSPVSDTQSIPTLEGWIENLMNCKQLAESDVLRLCDRVCELEGIVCMFAYRYLGTRSSARGVKCATSGTLLCTDVDIVHAS